MSVVELSGKTRCAHSNCGCPAGSDVAPAYCSGYCARADHMGPPPGACSCNHETCVASQVTAPADDEAEISVGNAPGAIGSTSR